MNPMRESLPFLHVKGRGRLKKVKDIVCPPSSVRKSKKEKKKRVLSFYMNLEKG